MSLTTSTTTRRLVGVVAVGVALTLTGCTGEAPPPRPTTTALPTATPSEVQGPAEESTGASMPIGRIAVYEVSRYKATEGCGCAVEEGGPEIFPAGSDVILLRVTLTGRWATWQKGDTWTVPGLEVSGTFVGDEGTAILDEKEGPKKAAQQGVAWLPSGLFPDGAGEIQNDVPVSFMLAYYVPRHANQLELSVSGYASPDEIRTPGNPFTLTVPFDPEALE